MESILPGFILGILGSLHCMGMCGPLALALPHISDKKGKMAFESFLYNFGRILTYFALGLIFGAIGSSIKLAGFQDVLSIVMGAGLLIVYFFPRKWLNFFGKVSVFKSVGNKFKELFRRFMAIKTLSSLFSIGLLNGLLPCGLVYVALAGAIANAGVLEGGFYMLAFGIGTFPMMFALYFSKGFLTPGLRIKLMKLIPVGVAVIGVLLILRGMSLGIPYISPVLHTIEEVPPCCR